MSPSINVTPAVVFLDDREMCRAVLGRSKFQIRRWEDEGLTVHVRDFPQGRRKYPTRRRFIVVAEYLAWLVATSTTNHELEKELDGDEEIEIKGETDGTRRSRRNR